VKIILLLVFLVFPLRQVENVQFCFSSQQHDIFLNYSNDNFTQVIYLQEGKLFSKIKSLNFFDINLNFRIILNKNYFNHTNNEIKDIIGNMPISTMTLREYLIQISHFLRKNIEYTDENLPQDPTSVLINNRANCIGYSNIFSIFLNSVNIKNRIVKGFYLEKENGPTLIPIPHRWVEIELLNGFRFFYDPQYNNFSANYIVVKDEVDFKKVKKFEVYMLKKSKEFVN